MSLRFDKAMLLSLMLSATSAFADSTPTAPAAAASNTRMLGPALRSTDLDRSIKFYTTGLGMVVATTLKIGSTTEVIFSFGGDRMQPVILLFKDESPGKSPPLAHGDAFGRIMLRVTDADALAAHLRVAGYAVGDVHANAVNHMKVFWTEDPDGYKYEITEVAIAKP